ncbi:MAG TPA: PQQ-binding-like beta-propeller repeat protein [Actinomycetota bacterium]|nr:PQQ-binding-like beta-propeller repeat protein [Actinomycetota bacterium]
MRTRLLAVLATVFLLAACGGGAEEPDEVGWRTDGVQAASGPAGFGDAVAVVDGATTDLKVIVLDAATGQPRFSKAWTPSARYGAVGVGRPALFEDVVVGMQPAGFQTALAGWDAATGKELWKVEVAETFGPFPCGDLVCSEDNWSLPSAALVARDPATGDTRWSSPGSQTYVYATREVLVEQDLNQPVLRSIDPSNGQDRWRTDLRTSLGPEAAPVVTEAQLVEGTLVVESNTGPNAPNGTVGLDPATGAVRWNHPGFGLCPQPTPDVLLVCSTRSGLQRLNPATGEALWTTERFRPPSQAGPLAGVTADLETMVGSDADAKPVAIDLETGEVSEPPAGLTFTRFSSNEQAKKGPDTPAGQYLGPLDPVPWDFKASRPVQLTDADDLPEFLGLSLAGMRIFLDVSGNLRALPAG